MKKPFKTATPKTDSGPGKVVALPGRTPSHDAAVGEALQHLAQQAHTEAGWTLASRAFLAEAASVGAARCYVRALLAAWGVVDHAENVVLCTSELATNAIQHAGKASDGFLVAATHQPDSVRIAVLDTSHRTPKPTNPSTDDLSGRGLQLVAAFADRWGSTVNLIGKTVWAEFDLPAGPGPEPEAPGGHPW